MSDEISEISEAIRDAFNPAYGTLIDAIVDSFKNSGENRDQSLVGVIDDLSHSTREIATAITSGLFRIAEAIESLND